MNPTHSAPPLYRDHQAPLQDRLDDLMSRMTLAEKIAQMQCVCRLKSDWLLDSTDQFDSAKAQRALGDRGLGQVARPAAAQSDLSPQQTAELSNRIQRFFIEHSRLGIPVIFHDECLHGYMAQGATCLPSPLAMASSFNPALVESLYALAATEASACGVRQTFAPVLDLARDPRWGRVEETFGEDPYLVAQMGVAAVRGLQGDSSTGAIRVLATPKHFAAHGQPESGTNCGPVNVSARELREFFLQPFKAVLENTRIASLMAAYNEIDGVPCHANPWLLQQVLRDQWGFDGYLVADYFGVQELHQRPEAGGHFVAADAKQAAALAVNAGISLELPDPFGFTHLADLVAEGQICEQTLDARVRPMLYWKLALGLFEQPYVDPQRTDCVSCPEHRQRALSAARECLILLSNRDHTLPLKPRRGATVAVIGPNADRLLLGGYSGQPQHHCTLLQAIHNWTATHRPDLQVVHSEGCGITVGGGWAQAEVTLPSAEDDQRQIAAAVALAHNADYVVLAVGGNEQTSREAFHRGHLGDRANLDLIGNQNALIDALASTGKPLIACVFNGSPLVLSHVAERADALLECWYLGQEGAVAVAEALFGDCNPSGKLPLSLPRSAGHLPVFYNHKPSARRGYLFDDTAPLFAFGYGLSYTHFALRNIRLERESLAPGESTQVLLEVCNTGSQTGAEVIQLYVRDCISSVTRPVKELKGFIKISLLPGESQTLALPITPDSLGFYNQHHEFVAEPGEFDIMIGTSSRDEDLTRLQLTLRHAAKPS